MADIPANLAETIRLAEVGGRGSAAMMVFPELGLSSYAIDDLLFQDALLASVEAKKIDELLNVSRGLYPVLVVGAPLRSAGGLFNTAVVIHRGSLIGVVPKTYLPNYREFYEKRHFSSGAGICGRQIEVAGRRGPFGTDLLFRSTGSVDVTFHVELCEDFWAPLPPSTTAALAGAEVLINLSASNITIGKADTRRLLCASQSRARSRPMPTRLRARGNPPPTWHGTAMRRSSSAVIGSPRPNGPHDRPWLRLMSISGVSVRNACGSTRSAIVPGRNPAE